MWILLLFFFVFTSPVHAQESTISAQAITLTPTIIPTPTTNPKVALFEQYKNDYLFQRDLYQKTYIDYTAKKQVHTKYGTLTTQLDKFNATKNTLLIRNKMLKTYLTALRVDLDKYKTASPVETEKNQINLSKWEDWFNEQNLIITAYNNDADIAKWVQNFNKQYVLIQKDIYTALVQHQINSKIQTLNEIKLLAMEIQNSPKNSIENQEWFSNLPIKSDLVMSSLKNAIDLTNKKQTFNKFIDFYLDSSKELNIANNYLTGILKDLKSIVIKFNQ